MNQRIDWLLLAGALTGLATFIASGNTAFGLTIYALALGLLVGRRLGYNDGCDMVIELVARRDLEMLDAMESEVIDSMAADHPWRQAYEHDRRELRQLVKER